MARGGELVLHRLSEFRFQCGWVESREPGADHEATVGLWFDGTPIGNPTVGALDAAWDQSPGASSLHHYVINGPEHIQ